MMQMASNNIPTTKVKSKQELELKAKSFIPPCAEEPEIYLKEGEYTTLRSASLDVLSRTTNLNNSAGTPTTSSSESQTESQEENSSSADQTTRRALSLDRRQNRPPMNSVRTASSPQVTQTRAQKPRNSRPPTPRVKERLFVKTNRFRSSSMASIKMSESIRESPTEQVEENNVTEENLKVETDTERVINSPPPRPQSETSKRNPNDFKIPVPTPTPTPQDLGKNDSDISNAQSNKDTHSLSEVEVVDLDHEDDSSHPNIDEVDNGQVGDKSEELENKGQLQEEAPNDTQHLSGEEEDTISNEDIDLPDDKETELLAESNNNEDQSERAQLTFDDSMRSKMGNEDVIVDPIKLLQGEGDSLKNGDENGRDHYDEGFHSGELVASEEDSNSIETLGSLGVKDEEEFVKPTIRAATPMPRNSSFYKVNLTPEIQQLQSKAEEMRAERRLRELKRDALMQKVRDLQKRKASSKDRGEDSLSSALFIRTFLISL
ncbi:SPATA1_C domain-containing protein [Nephila pilipes]|uniref:SPATA1_C domain-containing protein n=1 Tax=Nephila pilipes TaxID=299642 RepID=A0A8X6NVP5_NEPPI|nr:SPATA1_C domain-containing protein [Nephila pilipes]